jgi:predicted amidohydrolase
MKLGRFVIEGCVVVGLLVAGCHQSDSSVAQGPTTPKAAPHPQTAKMVEAAKPPAPPAAAPEPAKKFVLRVDCEAFESYKDKLGNVWVADQELGAGRTWGADDGMTIDRPQVGITGTEIPRIYETERYSMGSYKFTVPIPNEHTERYQEKAKKLNVYVQTGTFLESDAHWPGHVFNTTCLIGPDGIVSKYRKVHTWIPWELHTSPHDLADYDEPVFPVVDTEIGKIGTAICYDWLFPEAIRQLSLGGAELLVRVSAYMDPWGTAEPLDWWTLVNRVRALENMAYVVACNQSVSLQNYPPFSWPGGSMIVDYHGRVLGQAEPGTGERIVVDPIDLAALRAERERRRGHHMLAHLRTEVYSAYKQSVYPTGRRSNGTITVESNEASIRQGREALRRISRGQI